MLLIKSKKTLVLLLMLLIAYPASSFNPVRAKALFTFFKESGTKGVKAFRAESSLIKTLKFSKLSYASKSDNISELMRMAATEKRISFTDQIKYSNLFNKLDNGDSLLLACLKKKSCDLEETALLMQGKSELHQMAFIRCVPTNKQQLDKDVGSISEDVMHASYKNSGWSRLPSEINGRGIDGLYVKTNKDGVVVDVLIAETKYRSSPLGYTKDGKQMSHEWVLSRASQLKEKYPDNQSYRTIEKHVKEKNYRAQLFNIDVHENKMSINVTNIHSKGVDASRVSVSGGSHTLQTYQNNRIIDISNPSSPYHQSLVTQLEASLKKIDKIGVD